MVGGGRALCTAMACGDRPGADHFGNVAEVCGGYHPGEAVMAQVEKLDRLESLDLAYGPMTERPGWPIFHGINELLTVE